MKKLAAILLMAVFVFNLFGYRLWVYYAEQKAGKQIAAVLQNSQYDNESLLLIKKQVSLPYYNNSAAFTSANGEVEMNGVIYRYVKYRIYNDVLEMLCLPDTQRTRIKKAKDDYFSLTADIQKNNTGKNKPVDNTLKKSFSDFVLYTAVKIGEAELLHAKPYPALYDVQLGLLHKATVEQPPDMTTASV